MQKLACSLLFLCGIATTYQAKAQIAAGTKLVGGSLSFGSSTSSSYDSRNPSGRQDLENKSYGFSINPNAGVFLADNLAVGVGAGFSFNKSTYPYYEGPAPDLYEQVSKGYSIIAAPFLRYYYLPTETFGLYGQLSAGVSYGQGKSESSAANRLPFKSSSHSVFANITPALVFFPTAKLGLELAFGNIGYGRSTSKIDEPQYNQQYNRTTRKETYSGFGANFSLNNLALGASYYIGR